MLTKFFKSELFSCLPKVDHVINLCKSWVSKQSYNAVSLNTDPVSRSFSLDLTKSSTFFRDEPTGNQNCHWLSSQHLRYEVSLLMYLCIHCEDICSNKKQISFTRLGVVFFLAWYSYLVAQTYNVKNSSLENFQGEIIELLWLGQ